MGEVGAGVDFLCPCELTMKVYLGWSGERSKAVAEGLRDRLPALLQGVEPFLSAHIDAGARYERRGKGTRRACARRNRD